MTGGGMAVAGGEWAERRAGVKAAVAVGGVVAAMAAVGVAMLWFGVPRLCYAARWAGTPGVIRVRSCTEVPGRHVVEECTGRFRPDGGGAASPAVISQPLAPGEVVPVQRTAAGGYVPVGVSAVSGWLAETLLGTAVAGAAVLLGGLAARRPAPRTGWVLTLAAVAAALLSALVAALAAAVG